jgi:hypothetical protein
MKMAFFSPWGRQYFRYTPGDFTMSVLFGAGVFSSKVGSREFSPKKQLGGYRDHHGHCEDSKVGIAIWQWLEHAAPQPP